MGDPVHPTILNIVVDVVVRSILMEVCITKEAQNGLGWAAGEQDIVFYADYSRIARRNPIWVQGVLTTFVQMFEQVQLERNLGKTKYTACTPG